METDIVAFFKNNSPWFFLAYLIWKGLEPSIRLLLETIVPARVKRLKSNEERMLEIQEKDLDVRDREVTVLEGFLKELVLIKNNQVNFGGRWNSLDIKLTSLQSGISDANHVLGILRDRSLRRRDSDTNHDSKENKGE